MYIHKKLADIKDTNDNLINSLLLTRKHNLPIHPAERFNKNCALKLDS